ncbi:MAG TPA: universal stress protein [Burkholderiaceae bacterium]|nr:universal stress protein [Burkholderiaceae bacterium]
MFNGKVLVATDGSSMSERALETAAQLAARIGAVLTAVTVVEPYPYSGVGESSAVAGVDHQAQVGAEASARLARARELTGKAGVDCRTSMQEASEVHRGILTAADQTGAGLIVMASHGRSGLSALVLGSEAQKVLAHSGVPVLIVR